MPSISPKFYLLLAILGISGYTLRFLIQWILSEIKGESYVTKTFWYISIFSSCVMILYYFLQGQYNFCLIPTTNLVIAWRNLNLMQSPQYHKKFRTIILLFIFSLVGITTAFYLRDSLLNQPQTWFKEPINLWRGYHSKGVSSLWHLFGSIGILLFASRFWMQWWSIEKKHKSYLGVHFWYLSIVGTLVTLTYALKQNDLISIAQYSLGLIPYTRNLMLLIRKNNENQKQTA